MRYLLLYFFYGSADSRLKKTPSNIRNIDKKIRISLHAEQLGMSHWLSVALVRTVQNYCLNLNGELVGVDCA